MEVKTMSQAMDELQEQEVVIETHDLWRTYRLGPHQEVHALRGINLQVRRGEFVCMKGRSGSGKTTLLNCIGGLDRPTRGIVKVFNQDLSQLSERQLTHFRRMQVGYIFQSFGLSATYSAFENVELMLRISGAGFKERRERALYCLELVGLTRWRNHRPNEMSGGQQQRLAIARALANQPQLLLADEPTGKLDTATARDILALFKRIISAESDPSKRVTVLMAAHDPLVDEYAERVLRLKDGQIESAHS